MNDFKLLIKLFLFLVYSLPTPQSTYFWVLLSVKLGITAQNYNKNTIYTNKQSNSFTKKHYFCGRENKKRGKWS